MKTDIRSLGWKSYPVRVCLAYTLCSNCPATHLSRQVSNVRSGRTSHVFDFDDSHEYIVYIREATSSFEFSPGHINALFKSRARRRNRVSQF